MIPITALSSTYSKIKETGKHSIIYGISNALVTAIGVILVPVYTRYIVPSDYGVLALVTITLSILTTIFSLGIHSAVFRFYFDRDDEDYRKRVAGTAFILNSFMALLLALIGVLTAPYISLFLFSTQKYALLFEMMAIGSSANLIMQVPMSLLRAKRKSRVYAVFNVANFILRVAITIYLVVFLLMGIEGVVLARMIVALIMAFALVAYTIKDISFTISKNISKEILRFGSPLIFLNLSSFVLTWIDRYFLNIYRTLAEVGIYNLGYQLSGIIQTFLITPFQLVWAPLRFEVMHQGNARAYYKRIFLYFTFASMTVFLLFSLLSIDGIKIVAGRNYWDAYRVIPLVTLGYVFFGLCVAVNLGIGFEKKTEYGAGIVGISALINVLLNLYFIPLYGMIGAAFTTLVAYIVMFVLYYYVNQKLYPIKYDWRRVFILFLWAGIIFALGWFFPMDFIYSALGLSPDSLTAISIALCLRSGIVLLYPLGLWFGNFFTESERIHLMKLIGEAKARIFHRK